MMIPFWSMAGTSDQDNTIVVYVMLSTETFCGGKAGTVEIDIMIVTH